MAGTSSKVSLKLLIDAKSQRVLFAEAGKDFVDFLFNLLSLPMATVIQLLSEPGMEGSLSKLYESVESLNETYLQDKKAMSMLLNPTVLASGEAVPLLLPNIQRACKKNSTKYYACPNSLSSGWGCPYVSNDPTANCPSCGNKISTALTFVESPNNKLSSVAMEPVTGGFVKGVVTYMVMDNLEVQPMSTISGISMLNKYNVKDVGVLQEKLVDLGMDEGVKLVKASLVSKTVLTDVFLGKKQK